MQNNICGSILLNIINYFLLFIHCMQKYIALTFHWNKNRWKPLQICIFNFYGLSKNPNVNCGNSQLNHIYSINYLIEYQVEYYLKYLCKSLYIYKPWYYVSKEFLTKNIRRKPTLFSWNPLVMKCLRTSKFKIF